MENLKPSQNPIQDIEKISYPGQDPKRKMYLAGYESYFTMLPKLRDEDQFLELRVRMTKAVMQTLGDDLNQSMSIKDPGTGNFERTIVALEEPENLGDTFKEGTELVVANWGDGHSSPVHGHAPGYLHEEILFGKMRVNTFRRIDEETVRPLKTEIVKSGTFASLYAKKDGNEGRKTLIHNFTAIGHAATLHYLPEHTRDGRDNKFQVERFNDKFNMTPDDVTQITSQEGMFLQVGDVLVVRSTNVPEYGDHYVVITGSPVMKEHGLRPQDMSIFAPDATKLLDQFEMKTGLILLKLKKEDATIFRVFHGIKIIAGKVVMPETEEQVVNI